MREHELDHILSTEQGIAPSANFAGKVMDQVRLEAAMPPSIPFPWKRALPGLVLCILSLVAMCVAPFLRNMPPRVHEPSGPSIWTGLLSNLDGLLRVASAGGLGWILLALLLTLASVRMSLRLVGRRI